MTAGRSVGAEIERKFRIGSRPEDLHRRSRRACRAGYLAVAEDGDGLMTAEIEFPSEEAGAGFAPPSWLGDEVTGDSRYANQALARDGAPKDA